MLGRILGVALLAGLGVGLVVALVQHLTLVPLILQAEVYEHRAAQPHAHGGQDEPASAASPLTRSALTWAATTLTTIGFAFLLVGLFAVTGRKVDAGEGLLWGLAGFAAFALAPAFGLPPELPGSVSADLIARQAWWVGTVIATFGGLWLLALVRGYLGGLIGLALLVAPHVIGAPQAADHAGTVPPELAALFASRSLCVNALLWILLGCATATLYRRHLPKAP